MDLKNLYEIYEKLGISRQRWILPLRRSELQERFQEIDVLRNIIKRKFFMQCRKNKVNATCFAATTGYGYNDFGRERLRTFMRIALEAKLLWYVRKQHAARML